MIRISSIVFVRDSGSKQVHAIDANLVNYELFVLENQQATVAVAAIEQMNVSIMLAASSFVARRTDYSFAEKFDGNSPLFNI